MRHFKCDSYGWHNLFSDKHNSCNKSYVAVEVVDIIILSKMASAIKLKNISTIIN